MSEIRDHHRRPDDGDSLAVRGEHSEDAAVVRSMYRALAVEGPSSLASFAGPRVEWIHRLVT
jgi:hypothetical protein